MGLWDKISSQLIDIIEWLDDTRDTMVWRFPRYQNEIKNGAKLIVRESQVAAFIHEGKLGDIFHPGTYTLETKNLPILGTLKGWKYGFNSPFRSEVYFVNTRTFTDRKWGTKNPIMMRDPEFGPVRLRAFGSFAMKVSDPPTFIKQVAGTGSQFTIDEFDEQLRSMMVSRFADVAGESRVPVLDMASNYDEFGKYIATRMKDDFGVFGLELVRLVIENISLPPEVEAMMDKRTSMGVIGNMQNFAAFQAANAIPDAAKNNSMAGGMMGMGVGYVMANQMGNTMANAAGGGAGGAGGPPPIPQAVQFFAAIGGKQVGPFDVDQLKQKIAGGEISAQTLLWRQGMAAWTAAGQVIELNTVFAAMPPPLPPQA